MSDWKEVENVDLLMRQCVLPNRQRADYLALKRRVIIEQKSLDVDPDYKIQSFIDDHGITGIGEVSLASLSHSLSGLPDGNALQRELYQKITKVIDAILAKADKQTRDTRKTFFIPHAIGVVVILNDNAQLIEPDFVVRKAFEMLRKCQPATEEKPVNGEIRYPHNQVVILISETHRIVSDNAAELIPVETIFSEAGNQCQIAENFARVLRERWAEFNGASSVDWPELAREVMTRDPQKLFRTG